MRPWTWFRRVGLLLVTVVALEYLATRMLPDARRSWSSAGAAVPVLLLLALVAELGSTGCFSRLSSVLLPGGVRPRYRRILAIDVAGNGFSHVVPGGGAAAAALRFRLLEREGVPPADAVGAAALESAVSVLWLVAAMVLGLVVAVPDPDTYPLLRTASVLAVVLVFTFGGLVAVLAVRPDLVVTVTEAVARRLPLVRPGQLESLVRAAILQVRLVLGNRPRSTRAVLWGLANWVLDATSLYLCVWAFGAAPNPGGLITTYALVSLIALMPVTPGGLGIVEGVAVPLLMSFGTAHDAALLGVLAWRRFAFWLPIPLGLATYLWVRRSTAAPPGLRARTHGGDPDMRTFGRGTRTKGPRAGGSLGATVVSGASEEER